MAVALGYGGLANTNGTRSFVGKVEAEIEPEPVFTGSHQYRRRRRGARAVILAMLLGKGWF